MTSVAPRCAEPAVRTLRSRTTYSGRAEEFGAARAPIVNEVLPVRFGRLVLRRDREEPAGRVRPRMDPIDRGSVGRSVRGRRPAVEFEFEYLAEQGAEPALRGHLRRLHVVGQVRVGVRYHVEPREALFGIVEERTPGLDLE